MRQALGMIFLLGLIAGLIPFLEDLYVGLSLGAAVPVAHLARAGELLAQRWSDPFGVPVFANPAVIAEFMRTVAGLEQPLPGWVAALLSALGRWINVPLSWLSLWIVYGALVMAVNRLLGATNTLQRFYASTGYAAVPLILTGLGPIPCLGQIGTVVGWIWALAVYIRANQTVTGIPMARSLIGVLLPLALLLILAGASLVMTLLGTLILLG